MQLAPGMRLRSRVDTTEVVVVKAPPAGVDLRCGGSPMAALTHHAGENGPVDPRHRSGTKLGKRYGNDELGLELLCTHAGDGSLSVGDETLLVKAAKPLPSSD